MNEELIEQYLEEQRMTAVEKFAFVHDTRQIPETQALYKELIPKTSPGPGQQYAFEVNLDQCFGCKACITACHNENGLDEDETWRSVGLIHGGNSTSSVVQHVTTACHHCLDPACLNGCPVKAYEKDKETGIVKHLEDQCIGCQYCTFTCAYDVPKYSKKKGIVHKCDMCIGRLKAGEAPACVRACPSGAIRITLVDVNEVRNDPNQYVRIPDAPDSNYTLPTTRYLHTKEFPANASSADFFSVEPEHSHTPLIVMLVLTQLSVGAFVLELFLKEYVLSPWRDRLLPFHSLFALGVGLIALGASVLHLGRPLYAFRAILGLKTSWLSREILAFGLFAGLATIYALSYWSLSLQKLLLQSFSGKYILSEWQNILGLSTAGLGLLGVFCSVMVYQVTRRPLWDQPATWLKFFLTTGILGTSSMLSVNIILSSFQFKTSSLEIVDDIAGILCSALIILSVAKLVIESLIFLSLRDKEWTSLKKTCLLMTGIFKPVVLWRYFLGMLGGVILPAYFLFNYSSMNMSQMLWMSGFIFALSLAGEFLERYLFFRTVIPLKMPGMAHV